MLSEGYVPNDYIVNQIVVTFKDKELSAQEKTESLVIRTFFSGGVSTRNELVAFQDHIESLEDNLGEDPFPLFHTFSKGLYAREIHAPKDHAIVGKIHRHEHLVHLTKGSLMVADEFGTRKLEAPAIFASKAGVKRVGFTLEDVVWMDIHATDCTTVEEVEKDIFVDSYETLEVDNKIIEGEK